MDNIKDAMKSSRRRVLIIYSTFMLGNCVLLIGAIFFLLGQGLNERKAEFKQYVHRVHQSLSQSLTINETVLDGFAAYLAGGGMQDPNQVRFYARTMMDRYNHLYMFQAAQSVPGQRIGEFEQEMSLILDKPMLVHRFDYGRGLVPALESEYKHYYPIVFVEPIFTDGFSVVGLDISSIQFIKNAMDEARSSGLAAISEPIVLSDDQPAFVLVKPVYQNKGTEPGQFALLVVESDELIPSLRPTDKGMELNLALGGSEFSFLNVKTTEITGWTAWVFPSLVDHLYVHVGAQVLNLKVSKQLGLHHLNWTVITTLLLIFVAATVAIIQIYRVHLSAELTKQEASARLYQQANYDNLTQLSNRHFFADHFSRGLSAAERDGRKIGLLYLDLNDFKYINDTFGHQVGDSILRLASRLLREVIRDGDVASRFGGDEFVVMLENVTDDQDISRIITRIREVFASVERVDGHRLKLKSSIGYSTFPEDGDDLDALIKVADQRMYEDKRKSKQLGSVTPIR